MPTLQVNGTTVAFTDTGYPRDRAGAATIVFGHGLLFSGWMFSDQIAALSEQYRCVAIDWRGRARHRRPPTVSTTWTRSLWMRRQ